ncbi:hypothetical protein [Mycobacterium sp.]|jgi:hypothetical protein|uniref:hypothetical protein n=1 Tax=Mycobacterium sp. TaxID=1785 RepID=UPI002EF72B2C
MTTVEHIRSIASSNTVTIAGVPWPRYKVLALLVSLLVALVVGVVTMSTGAAVLTGAGAGTLVWLALGSAQNYRH